MNTLSASRCMVAGFILASCSVPAMIDSRGAPSVSSSASGACATSPTEQELRRIKRDAEFKRWTQDMEHFTSVELCRLVYSLPAIPDSGTKDDISDDDWNHAIRVAAFLQAVDPEEISYSLDRYCRHFQDAFHEGVNCVDEWSKTVVLMELYFDVPASRTTHGRSRYAGFSFAEVRGLAAKIPRDSGPVQWLGDRPRLVCRRLAYMGSVFRAGEEFDWMVRHHKMRQLRPR